MLNLTVNSKTWRKMSNFHFTLVLMLTITINTLAQDPLQPQVVRETNNNDGSGNYLFTYELDNGQIFSETGELRTIGDQQAVVKSGSYSCVGVDGQTYWVTYTADENGYHPVFGIRPGGIASGQDASFNPQY